MKNKLFIVTIETEVVVKAEDCRDAEKVAAKCFSEIKDYDMDEYSVMFASRQKPLQCKKEIPDWCENSIPYSMDKKSNKTCEELLDENEQCEEQES